MADAEIEIELDLAPIRYKLELEDPKKVDKAIRTLKSFIKTNDDKLLEAASYAVENRRKNTAKLSSSKPIEIRLPGWFRASNFSLAEAIALLLYFVNKPLNTRQLTALVNRELPGKKKDLRNVSKHLTSKGKSLYGYTVYDKVSQTFELNEYGRKWVENDLIPDLKKVQKETENNA